MKSANNFKSEIVVKGKRLTLAFEKEVTFTTQDALAKELKESKEYGAIRCWYISYSGHAAERFFVLGFK